MRLFRLSARLRARSIGGEPEMGWILATGSARQGLGAGSLRGRPRLVRRRFGRHPIWAIIAPGNEPSMKLAAKLGFVRSAGRYLSRRADKAIGCGRPGRYQPPPPPPPPPPPEDPPPPEPLLDPGAVDAELTVLDSDEPTLSTKPVGLLQGLLDPEYQPNPWRPCAAAAARTLGNGPPSDSRHRARSHREDSVSNSSGVSAGPASSGRAARAR